MNLETRIDALDVTPVRAPIDGFTTSEEVLKP
jgi:hypothetical protein